jgi:hypothetical protein
MNEQKNVGLTCLECGQPIPDGRRWLCSDRCAAVLALVHYGRSQIRAGYEPERDRLNRYRRTAGIVGRFPTDVVRSRVLPRLGQHGCEYPGCTADATHVDWRADDPDLRRQPRAEDLRRLCAAHHRSESLRRFIGPGRQIVHTAPATWARIEAAEPLVSRDNERLWDDASLRRLLTRWPLASEPIQRDLEAVMRTFALLPPSTPGADGETDDVQLAFDRLSVAMNRLGLPRRQQARLWRVVNARLLAVLVDGVSPELGASHDR